MLELGPEGGSAPPEALNEKAVKVIRRVQDKLAGLDFANDEPYDVDKQVDLLIKQVPMLKTSQRKEEAGFALCAPCSWLRCADASVHRVVHSH